MAQASKLTRRRLFAATCAAMAAPAFAARAAADLSLEDVIDRNVRARGGAQALDRIRHTHSSLRLSEGGHTVEGGYIASTLGLVRVDIFQHGKRVYSEGVDAQGGWNWDGDAAAPTVEGEEGTKNLRRGIEFNLYGLHRFRARGHKLNLAGRERVDGIDYYVVEAQMADGSVNNFYLNPQTWQSERTRSVRIFHPDLNPGKAWIESRMSDFYAVDGVTVARRGEEYDLVKKQVIQSTVGTGVTFNQSFDPAVFARTFKVESLKSLGVPVQEDGGPNRS